MFTLLAGNDWFEPDFNWVFPVAVWEALVDLLDYVRSVDASGLYCFEEYRTLLEHPVSDVQGATPQQLDPLRPLPDQQH